MSFTVEDGTGVKGANSYASLAFFNDYFADRAEDADSLTNLAENLLIAATDYIDTRWFSQWLGRREFLALTSRSILTVTVNPIAAETVTFGGNTYTFVVTPVLDTDVEIGEDIIDSLGKLARVISLKDTDDFAGSRLIDEDAVSVALFAVKDGVVTTEALASGSFDAVTTAGKSVKQQLLEFPRIRLRDAAHQPVIGIPEKLKQATCEYAFRADSTTLAPDPTVEPSGRLLTKDNLVIGPITIETEFAEEIGTVTITKSYPTADRLLKEFIRPGGTIRS